MRHLVLLVLPAIFGMVYGESSGEIFTDYDPLKGPPQGAIAPLVQQNHGAAGDPLGAAKGIEPGGPSGEGYDYNLYDGPPAAPNGPQVRQLHGYAGAPQVGAIPNTGGSSNDDGGAARAGGSLGAGNPQIIPGNNGGDSNDDDGETGAQVFGGTGGQQNANAGVWGAAAAAGDSSNSVDAAAGGNPFSGGNAAAAGTNTNYAPPAAPNAAPVAGGADIGQPWSRNQNLEASSSSLSGGAVAGIVLGVIAVGAVGTAVAVVVLKSGASTSLLSAA